jgi:acetyltransferase-like isoleucine patch superfamily enzyme
MIFQRIFDRIIFGLFRYFKPDVYLIKRNFKTGSKLENTRASNTVTFVEKDGISLGNNVFIWHHTIIDGSNQVEIEEGCQIGAWNGIFSHSSHISIRLYGSEYGKHQPMKGYVRGKVKIGKYTFIGPHCVIMPNTTIGKGSLVSAYSYVKGEFPDFSIIAGNPAKIVGDTRKLDQKYLDNNEELRGFYEEWASC